MDCVTRSTQGLRSERSSSTTKHKGGGSMRALKTILLVAVAAALVTALAACGSSSSSSSTGSASSGNGSLPAGVKDPKTESLTGGKQGGVLNEEQSEDFEHLDPGQSYFQLDYQ